MPPRLKYAVKRKRLQLALLADVSDKLDRLALADRTSVTAVVTKLILEASARHPGLQAPKKRANARPRRLAVPSVYQHPSGPIYVSWAGFSRLGYIRSRDSMPAHLEVPPFTDFNADRWAEDNPPGTPETYDDPVWVRDPYTGDRVPPTPDPDVP